MIQFTQQQFEEIKSRGELLYKTLGDVYCPYFGCKVSFNSKGLEHLKFKERGKTRLERDQYMRFKLIYLVPEVLKVSHTVQGILETKMFERIRINNRTDTLLKPVNYYEFIAVIKRNRIKVIVKQIDGGDRFFWSIIPFWGMNTDTMTRLLYEGTPEED